MERKEPKPIDHFEQVIRTVQKPQEIAQILQHGFALDYSPDVLTQAINDAIVHSMKIFGEPDDIQSFDGERYIGETPYDVQAHYAGIFWTAFDSSLITNAHALLNLDVSPEIKNSQASDMLRKIFYASIKYTQMKHERKDMSHLPVSELADSWMTPHYGWEEEKDISTEISVSRLLLQERLREITERTPLSDLQVIGLAALTLDDGESITTRARLKAGEIVKFQEELPLYKKRVEQLMPIILATFDNTDIIDPSIVNLDELKTQLLTCIWDDYGSFMSDRCADFATFEEYIAQERADRHNEAPEIADYADILVRYARTGIIDPMLLATICQTTLETMKKAGERLTKFSDVRENPSRIFPEAFMRSTNEKMAYHLTRSLIENQVFENIDQLKEKGIDPEKINDLSWYLWLSTNMKGAIKSACSIVVSTQGFVG